MRTQKDIRSTAARRSKGVHVIRYALLLVAILGFFAPSVASAEAGFQFAVPQRNFPDDPVASGGGIQVRSNAVGTTLRLLEVDACCNSCVRSISHCLQEL